MAANVGQAQPIITPGDFMKALSALEPLAEAVMLSRFMTIDFFNEPLRYEAGIALSEGRIQDGMLIRNSSRMEWFEMLVESYISDSESEISAPEDAETISENPASSETTFTSPGDAGINA